ncbi:MAG: hypothetical protein JWM48_550 [Mycobacterium sp.]|jgi:hypothetical protein|nr:hypothetical protein [Mycobacterium sp.]
MFPTSVAAVLVIVIAILPGSSYTWAYERQAASFGVTAADRTLRFIGVSVVLHLLLGWPEYLLYREAFTHRPFGAWQFAAFWGALVLLLALPGAIGTTLGGLYSTRTTREGWRWVRRRLGPVGERRLLRALLGPDPAPRAWDDFFSERPTVYIRARTHEGSWVGGLFASRSYAAGFPHDPDLYLEEARSVDPVTGELGDVPLGYSIYLPAGTVEWLEIVPPEAAPDELPAEEDDRADGAG